MSSSIRLFAHEKPLHAEESRYKRLSDREQYSGLILDIVPIVIVIKSPSRLNEKNIYFLMVFGKF